MRLAAIALLACLSLAAESVPIIFDTDMGNDIDDALALALLHSLESRGECRILAVTITKDNPWSAAYVDVVNTFYGRPNIPIGVVKGSGITPKDSDMIRVPALAYPHRLASGNDAPDAVAVLRRVLDNAADHSVVIVQVGFSTNLAHLLDADGGRDLARRKVKLLVMMAGNFAQSKPEFNVQMDVPSAQRVFRDWPTPIVASGWEVGNSMLFPAASIEHDFAYTDHHPIADAYRHYMPMPYDRPTWDVTAALYAVRPGAGYFSLSPPGEIEADSAGRTRFTPGANGQRRYLIVGDNQRGRTLEAMVLLASQPPAH